MAKSKKQFRQELRDKRDTRKFMTVVVISTVVLLLLLYFVFRSSL